MKKEKSFGIIYKAEFKNGKVYIGQTTRSFKKRKREHLNALYDENVVFHNAIIKYGKSSIAWSVIDTADSLDELNEKEKYWIAFYNSHIHFKNSNGYNMTIGGDSTLGWKPSEETKRKISEANKGKLKGKNNPQYGKTGELSTWWGRKHTKEEKQKIGDGNREKTLSQETKDKISIANSGKNNGNYGKKFSKETRKKMSESRKKYWENKKNEN